MTEDLLRKLRQGAVIPAHPLALNRERKLDERRQRALTRYYLAAGAGGIAVGVHTTQFEIREPGCGLLRPVLELAAETAQEFAASDPAPPLKIAGICGTTRQAVAEARLAADFGYHAGLLSLGALAKASIPALLTHVRAVAAILPVFGFYLQPAVGGRALPYRFWRELAEIDDVVAIKIAPFNRYQTLDVIRAVSDAGQLDRIALYTGNDDNILMDLATPYRFAADPEAPAAQIVGGLLGHWAVWTRRAYEHWAECRRVRQGGLPIPQSLAALAHQVTDANAAIFDPDNQFAGCLPGIHEILRRQGLLEGVWLLDQAAGLSPGQSGEIDRVQRSYPHLHDDPFVAEHLDAWLH